MPKIGEFCLNVGLHFLGIGFGVQVRTRIVEYLSPMFTSSSSCLDLQFDFYFNFCEERKKEPSFSF